MLGLSLGRLVSNYSVKSSERNVTIFKILNAGGHFLIRKFVLGRYISGLSYRKSLGTKTSMKAKVYLSLVAWPVANLITFYNCIQYDISAIMTQL